MLSIARNSECLRYAARLQWRRTGVRSRAVIRSGAEDAPLALQVRGTELENVVGIAVVQFGSTHRLPSMRLSICISV